LQGLTKGTRRRSRSGSDRVGAPGSAPRPNLDVHNVKERGAAGAVVVRAHGTRARTHAHALSARELSLGDVRLVLRVIFLLPDRRREDPAPAIPVSVSSRGRTAWWNWGRPNWPSARRRAANRSVDKTVRWRRVARWRAVMLCASGPQLRPKIRRLSEGERG